MMISLTKMIAFTSKWKVLILGRGQQLLRGKCAVEGGDVARRKARTAVSRQADQPKLSVSSTVDDDESQQSAPASAPKADTQELAAATVASDDAASTVDGRPDGGHEESKNSDPPGCSADYDSEPEPDSDHEPDNCRLPAGRCEDD
jgi:hypothetical protein